MIAEGIAEGSRVFTPVDDRARHGGALRVLDSADVESNPRFVEEADGIRQRIDELLPVRSVRSDWNQSDYRSAAGRCLGHPCEPMKDTGASSWVTAIGRVDVDCAVVPRLSEAIVFRKAVLDVGADRRKLI